MGVLIINVNSAIIVSLLQSMFFLSQLKFLVSDDMICKLDFAYSSHLYPINNSGREESNLHGLKNAPGPKAGPPSGMAGW